MIIGDSYKFAILSGEINEWNIDDAFCNGTDKRLYTLPPQQAFAEIYGITFPEDMDSDNEDCFDITPASLSDHNCFVFAVCDGVNVRVLASELVYEMENGRHKLQDIAISETFVSVREMKEIISGLENFPCYLG